MPKLFLVHCGFYDKTISGGLFEGHTNILIAADSFADAKSKAKQKPEFKRLKMHVDGIQELNSVDGYDITLKLNAKNSGATVIRRQRYGSNKLEHVEL